jgi:hypothetical protein
MKKRKVRTNADLLNLAVGGREAIRLEREIRALIDDEPINLRRLQEAPREGIRAVKMVRASGVRSKQILEPMERFESYCKSILSEIIGREH